MKIEKAGETLDLEGNPLDEPNAPTCETCAKTFAEPTNGNTCIVCLEKAGTAPPSASEQARAEVAAAKADPRPSLDVAIETHGNLSPRIEALCARLSAWDTSKLGDMGQRFSDSVQDLRANCLLLGEQLGILKAMGFVAKSTPRSRRDRAIAEGRVQLNEATRMAWSKRYTEEELSQVEIVAIDGELVWIKLTKPAACIPVKRTQLVPA